MRDNISAIVQKQPSPERMYSSEGILCYLTDLGLPVAPVWPKRRVPQRRTFARHARTGPASHRARPGRAEKIGPLYCEHRTLEHFDANPLEVGARMSPLLKATCLVQPLQLGPCHCLAFYISFMEQRPTDTTRLYRLPSAAGTLVSTPNSMILFGVHPFGLNIASR